MKLMEIKSESRSVNPKEDIISPPPPPPLPPPPKFPVVARPVIQRATVMSVTNQEIATYWRQKRVIEEDHLLAAIKAAARIRARNFSEEDYQQFVESLEDDDDTGENDNTAKNSSQKDQKIKEIRVGIKDWWTKSKYAYLNQPAIKSMDTPKQRASTYVPQFYCYKSAPPPAATATTFGIF